MDSEAGMWTVVVAAYNLSQVIQEVQKMHSNNPSD
jgi:hypothetical protein